MAALQCELFYAYLMFRFAKTIYSKLYIYKVALRCEFSCAFLVVRRINNAYCKLRNSETTCCCCKSSSQFLLNFINYSYLFDLCKICNKIQIQQNYIVKIITKSSFFKIKKLSLWRLNNISKLEILKFIYNYLNKSLPKCFSDFSAMLRNYSSQLHLR